MFKPIAWAMIDEDGQFIDAIHPDEHARIEGDYKHPVYIASQQPTIDKSAAIRIATALGWEPKREWVGLTEAQCGFLWKVGMTPFEYYQAIEVKLKELNT